MRIRKAKIKEGQLYIQRETSEGDIDEKTSMQSLGGYHPDLEAAFSALAKHVRVILDWGPEQYQDKIFVTSVSWSWDQKSGIEAAIITGHAILENKLAFNFNTPLLRYEPYGEAKNQALMSEEAKDDLAILRGEVRKFLEGKRPQGELFADGDNDNDDNDDQEAA